MKSRSILVVMMGWVLFRADTLTTAGQYFAALCGWGQQVAPRLVLEFGTNQVLCAIVVGIVFSGPAWPGIKNWCARLSQAFPSACRPALHRAGITADVVLSGALLLVSLVWLASGTYNPFIYFRF